VQSQRRQPFSARRSDAQHGQIGARVGGDHARFEFAPVGQHDGDLVAFLDDMVVGDDQPVPADQHARTQ
jgi:hypothetical protein